MLRAGLLRLAAQLLAQQRAQLGGTAGGIGMDRKGRTMQLSIKAKDEAEMQEAVADYNRAHADAASGTTKLGALLREQLGSKSE